METVTKTRCVLQEHQLEFLRVLRDSRRRIRSAGVKSH
jgi:hypothetical protein